MSDYSFNFSTQSTASPWTVPSPLLKLSTQNLAITNGSGVRSSANGNNAWLCHNVNYTGGTTPIQADITVPAWVLSGDLVGPGVFVRSGGNAGNGYAIRVDGGGAMYIDKISGGNFTGTQLNSVGSTGVITGLQNGVSKLTATDTTFAAETTLAAGAWASPGNTNSQYIKTFAGTGVAATGGIAVGGSGSVGSGTAVSSLTTSATTTQVSGSSFLLCAAYSVSGSITSVSDNKSNFYTAIGPEIANPTDGRFMRLFVFASGAGGSAHTCTVNFSTAQAGTAVFVEVTGGAASNIVDALTVILAGGGSPYACPLVTNASTDLLVGFISSAVTGAESFSSSVLTNSITQFTNATSGFGAGGALSGVASGAARYDPAIADTASFARALVAVVAIKQSGATSTDSLLGQVCL
jgi:hypothetical protein